MHDYFACLLFLEFYWLSEHYPKPTNVTKKQIDSSARKSLIYIRVTVVPSGLRPSTGGAGRRENVQTERKRAGYWQKWFSPQSARTRSNTRKHAVVGKKKPTG